MRDTDAIPVRNARRREEKEIGSRRGRKAQTPVFGLEKIHSDRDEAVLFESRSSLL